MALGWLPTAFLATLLAVGIPFWTVPYGQLTVPNILLVPGLVIVLPLAAGLRFFAVARSAAIVASLVGAMLLANVLRIAVDIAADPTAHNLFPFELAATLIVGGIFAGIGCILGKLAGFVVARFRAGGGG